MGTRSSKNKLETKVKYQRETISRLEDDLRVAHRAREDAEGKLAKAKQDIVWQKERVAKRDTEIKELKGKK